jgi:hypothetical protein
VLCDTKFVAGRRSLATSVKIGGDNFGFCNNNEVRNEPPAGSEGDAEKWLSFSKDDATFGQIIGRQFHANLIPRDDANKILAHSSRNVCENFRARLQLHPKTGVGQRRSYRTFNFKSFFVLPHTPQPAQTNTAGFLATLP